ncbi:MAG: hypothetical protein AAGH57_04705 [Pseudomonadota bacterium]
MNGTVRAALNSFYEDWRPVLSQRVRLFFASDALPETGLTPAAKADAFAVQHGFQPIGFNWEMLDPEAGLGEPRSALGTIVEALQRDIAQPSREWLDEGKAHQCATQFLGAFAQGNGTILTNHLNGLWWPISEAADEWTFVAMDEDTIALWLMAA